MYLKLIYLVSFWRSCLYCSEWFSVWSYSACLILRDFQMCNSALEEAALVVYDYIPSHLILQHF